MLKHVGWGQEFAAITRIEQSWAASWRTFRWQAVLKKAPALEHCGLIASLAHAVLHAAALLLLGLEASLAVSLVLPFGLAVPPRVAPLFMVLINASLHSWAQAAAVRSPHGHLAS